VDEKTQTVVAQAATDINTGSYTIALPIGSTYQLQVTATEYFAVQQLITNLAALDTIYLQPIEKQKAIVLDNLYFASFQTTILPESEGALNQLYTMLTDNPEVRIRIIGHTDDVGSDKDNQILSEGRAKSVRQAMIDRGIDPNRIEFEGRGEQEPVATNKTEEGRAKNRRVEFVIL
jgi:outer membrane protein OmpA-like peptidoglycan-associated protein